MFPWFLRGLGPSALLTEATITGAQLRGETDGPAAGTIIPHCHENIPVLKLLPEPINHLPKLGKQIKDRIGDQIERGIRNNFGA